MTTNDRASALTDQLIARLGVRFPMGGGQEFRRAIVEALTDARSEALEEAARVACGFRISTDENDEDFELDAIQDSTADRIERRIRALKEGSS
jgi:hypothetical protein